MVNWAVMGDPNGSIPTVEPTFYRPMFGAHPRATASTCITFISGEAHDRGVHRDLALGPGYRTGQE